MESRLVDRTIGGVVVVDDAAAAAAVFKAFLAVDDLDRGMDDVVTTLELTFKLNVMSRSACETFS